MDRSVSKELRIRETGNHPQHALLLGNSQPRLESDDVPHVAVPVFATKLNDRPWSSARARIRQPNRLQRTEAQCVSAAFRRDLDRHASFEVRDFVELVTVKLVRGRECGDERFVLLARSSGN